MFSLDGIKIEYQEETQKKWLVLEELKTGLEEQRDKITDDIYEQEMILENQIEYPASGYGGPSGPLEERNEVRMYRVELEEIGSMVDNMLYAISQYKEYYEGYGAYPGGELVFDAAEVEIILDNFKELIGDNGWQDKIKKDDFSFNVWERSIMAGIEKENSRERAVQYNRGINDKLRTELAAMTTILKNKTDLLASNSSVYVMDLKPLVDGVTVNEILSQFDIEDIDYKRLQANTDVLNYVESSVEASGLLYDSFSDQNGDVTFESIMKNLKNGITLTNGEVSMLQNKLSKLVNAYDITGVDYFYYNETVDGYFLKLTDKGYTELRVHIERTLEELHVYSIKGVYKKTDPEYIDLKNSGKLADTSRYLSYGGYIIDATLLSKSIAEGDLSEAAKQLGGILGGLAAPELLSLAGITDGAILIPIVALGLGELISMPLEKLGNRVESNEDWFGDGIDW